MALKKTSVSLLLATAAAMFVEPNYHLATPAEASELLAALLAEQNPDIAEGDHVATRLTEAGMTEAKANGFVEPAADEGDEDDTVVHVMPAAGFVIEDAVAIPGARGGKGQSIYPFDKLEVTQSFFIPATAEMDNPAKSLASTVSSATARFAIPVEGETETKTFIDYQKDEKGAYVKNAEGKRIQTGKRTETVPKMKNTRVFTIRTVDETAQGRGKGARVWRTA